LSSADFSLAIENDDHDTFEYIHHQTDAASTYPYGNLLSAGSTAFMTLSSVADTNVGDFSLETGLSLGQDVDWMSFTNDLELPVAAPYHLTAGATAVRHGLPSTGYSHITTPFRPVHQRIAPAATNNALSTSSAQSASTTGPQVSIQCTFPGCNKTFRRVGDRRRHEGKHQARAYKCIDADCQKRFYRLDKVRDHLRQGHGILW